MPTMTPGIVECMHCAWPIERKGGRWCLVGEPDDGLIRHFPDWR